MVRHGPFHAKSQQHLSRYLQAPKVKRNSHLVVLHKLRRDAISRYETPRDFRTISAQARPQSLHHEHIVMHCTVAITKHVLDSESFAHIECCPTC